MSSMKRLRCFPSKGQAAQGAFGCIVRETDPAVLGEAGKTVPALEHVVDGLNDVGGAREPGALLGQPCLQFGQERCAPLLPDAQALVGAEAVDVALDVEQQIDALDRLQRDWRDRRRRSSTPGILRNIGQFEEQPSCVRPTKGRRDRRGLTSWIVESIEAAVGVGLKNAGEALKMPRRMFAATILVRRNRPLPAVRPPNGRSSRT